jgi:GT2 family glycosyltransferase
MPIVSIVIPSLNSAQIARVVEALQRQTAQRQILEIIVVGRDERGLLPGGVLFIDTGRPISAAAARNRGARAAAGEYLLFIDSDCVAAPDLVERLLAAHAHGRPAVGGSIAPGNDDYWMRCDHMLIFSAFLPETPPGPRPFLPSGCFSIQRELFLEQGGFDERFPGAAGEEVDFCLGLRERGIELFFEPHAQVAHCHARLSPAVVWSHLRRFGQVQVTIWQRRPRLAAAPLGSRLRLFSSAILAWAPLLATLDIARLFGRSPTLRRHWRLAPGMAWARTGWYWGVAEALLAHP